jgi:hypothetical protein
LKRIASIRVGPFLEMESCKSRLEWRGRNLRISARIWRLTVLFVPALLALPEAHADAQIAKAMPANALTVAVLYSCSAVAFTEASVQFCMTAYPDKKDEFAEAFDGWKKRNEETAAKLETLCQEKGDASLTAKAAEMRRESVKRLQDSEQDRIRTCGTLVHWFASRASDIERRVPNDMLRQIRQK